MRYRQVLLALALATASLYAQQYPEFDGATWSHQEGTKNVQTDVLLVYNDDALAIWPQKRAKGSVEPLVKLPYADVGSAEYTFGKSPRVAAALLVSPLFLFSSSKSHWLTVKLKNGDFALLRLDKGNYKLVLAELERRSHVTVESIGENK